MDHKTLDRLERQLRLEQAAYRHRQQRQLLYLISAPIQLAAWRLRRRGEDVGGGTVKLELFDPETDMRLIDGEARVDSRAIARNLNLQHESVMKLLRDYDGKFIGLGEVVFESEQSRFEIGKVVGGRPQRYCLLNEDQAVFLLTLSRNTSEAVEVKLALTVLFRKYRDAAKQQTIDLRTPAPLALAKAILESVEEHQQQIQALEQRTAQIEQAIHDQPINSVQVGQIHRLGQEWGRLRGSYGGAWHDFKAAFGLASYRDLPQSRYSEALSFLNTQIATLQTTGLFVEGAEA